MYVDPRNAHPLARQLAGKPPMRPARAAVELPVPAADWRGWLIIPAVLGLLVAGWLDAMLSFGHVAGAFAGIGLAILDRGEAAGWGRDRARRQAIPV